MLIERIVIRWLSRRCLSAISKPTSYKKNFLTSVNLFTGGFDTPSLSFGLLNHRIIIYLFTQFQLPSRQLHRRPNRATQDRASVHDLSARKSTWSTRVHRLHPADALKRSRHR